MDIVWHGEGDLAWIRAENEEEAKFLDENKHLSVYSLLDKWQERERS